MNVGGFDCGITYILHVDFNYVNEVHMYLHKYVLVTCLWYTGKHPIFCD